MAKASVDDATLSAIYARRSIRRGFDGRAIPTHLVEAIVHSGLTAPSSKNAQPWRLHVVRDPQTLCEIADAVQNAKDAATYVPVDPHTGLPRTDWPSTVAESAEVLRQAPLGLFIENRGEFSRGRATLASLATDRLAAALVGYTFEIVGIGAAIENMWIAAQALGIRGVFMGDIVIAEQHIVRRLDMRGDLVGVLALGYSDAPPWRERFFEPDRAVWH